MVLKCEPYTFLFTIVCVTWHIVIVKHETWNMHCFSWIRHLMWNCEIYTCPFTFCETCTCAWIGHLMWPQFNAWVIVPTVLLGFNWNRPQPWHVWFYHILPAYILYFDIYLFHTYKHIYRFIYFMTFYQNIFHININFHLCLCLDFQTILSLRL